LSASLPFNSIGLRNGRVPHFDCVALNLVEHVGLHHLSFDTFRTPVAEFFSDEKKLSITALSQTLSDRLFE
jgi:hypothetical protein